MKIKKVISKVGWGILIFTIILIVFIFAKRTFIYLDNKIPQNTFNDKNVIETVVDNEIEKKNSMDLGIEKNDSIELIIDKDTFWIQEEKHYSKYQISIKNILDKNIDNWKLVIHLNQNVSISDSWNTNVQILNNDIIFEGVENNIAIKPQEKTDIGGIFFADNKIEFAYYTFYLNDEIVKADKMIESEKEQNTNKDTNEIIKDYKNSPVAMHGKLSVKGKNIVDKKGKKFLIQGISTHSIKDYSQYINYDSFKYLKEELNCNTIRLALYSDPGVGYTKELHEKVDEGIKYATDLGLYVIIDWHILNDKDPNTNKESAKEFFIEMANKYKDYENILYEICNEPNGDVSWMQVKNYALEVIPLIREIDDDSIIIIGTPNFCQKIEDAQNDPIQDYDNLLYSLHFYSASHKDSLRKTLNKAYDADLPIIVSEFGLSEATGNGNINEEEANIWIDLLREKNIGYICWNLSNKNESCAMIKPEVQSVSGWNDEELTQVGVWIKNKYNN